MNICFYTDYTISGMTGGIGRVTSVLTDYFRSNFHWKVFSIFAFNANENCVLTDVDGAVHLRLHDRLGARNLSSNYKEATKFIEKHHIDIVIIQTSLDVVAKLRKALDEENLLHVKICSVLHYSPGTDEFPISINAIWEEIKKGKLSIKNLSKVFVAPIYNIWEHKATVQAYRKAYQYGNATVLLSESYIPEYIKYANLRLSEKLFAIPNCVPFEYNTTKDEVATKAHTALVVGRMVDYPKRISSILNIWQAIETEDRLSDWNLKIVGDGPDLLAFKNQASKKGLKRCTFVGRQNPLPFYLESSIFLMTSEFEGFPMTLVEAQQTGCVPVVYNSFGSLKEVVTSERNGIVITPNDEKQFVNAIINLASDSELRNKLALNAIEDCKKFSQSSICSQWRDFIEQIVKE